MHPSVKKLLHGIVISVQAYEDTPLYGPETMKRMAQCAIIGQASGLRSCWPQDIKAIRSITDLPIIGINKKFGSGNPLDEIFITPTFASAKEIIEAGCDIVGLDCTIRPSRGFTELYFLLKKIKTAYPDIAIMADIATLEEGIQAAQSGLVDIVSTTLSGYTRQSQEQATSGPNIALVKALKEKISLPVNAEGRVWEVADIHHLVDAGSDVITIGSAVTRPQDITKRFVECNRQYRSS